MSDLGRWTTLALLGAYHGVNPGMGWLFAVALGLQEKRGGAVVRALPPIALGHAVSVGLAVALLGIGQAKVPATYLRWGTAAVLAAFGIYKLVRPRHPRWVGMRVGFRDLTLWSFLMASAHGAGLMLLPVFLLRDAELPCHGACHDAAGLSLTSWGGYLAAIGVHTGAMLLAAAAVALIVYYRLGVAILRQTWFNLDSAWAVALIGAGAIAVVL
ncbi:Arginine/ornithine antiporter ArcD [Minicystis rosea]|nr:Arginine/ornithine antiporter ArcD [Minicystis rosea]